MHYDRPSICGERFDVIVCWFFSRDSDRSEEKMVSRGTIVQKVHCFESSKNTVRRQTNEISGFSKKIYIHQVPEQKPPTLAILCSSLFLVMDARLTM